MLNPTLRNLWVLLVTTYHTCWVGGWKVKYYSVVWVGVPILKVRRGEREWHLMMAHMLSYYFYDGFFSKATRSKQHINIKIHQNHQYEDLSSPIYPPCWLCQCLVNAYDHESRWVLCLISCMKDRLKVSKKSIQNRLGFWKKPETIGRL